MLMRAYSKVDEDGRIAVGRQFWRQLRWTPPGRAGLMVIRLVGSSRKPYLFVYHPDTRPRPNEGFECVVWQGQCTTDEAGRMCLWQDLVEDTGFAPRSHVEIKVAGAGEPLWLAIRWRGPAVTSTLQERMNVRGVKRKRKRGSDKWKPMPVEY